MSNEASFNCRNAVGSGGGGPADAPLRRSRSRSGARARRRSTPTKALSKTQRIRPYSKLAAAGADVSLALA
jgi:hypothetical protein